MTIGRETGRSQRSVDACPNFVRTQVAIQVDMVSECIHYSIRLAAILERLAMNNSRRGIKTHRTQNEIFAEKTYAGVWGKLCGVYLGRTLEVWTYGAIRKRFNEVDYYVAEQ